METACPRVFRFSPHAAALIQNLTVICGLTPIVGAILRWLVFRLPFDFVMSAVGGLGLLYGLVSWRLLRNTPGIEAWPDHVKVANPEWARLRAIYYNQIVSLERIEGIGLEIFYVAGRKKQKVSIGERYVVDFEDLERLLRDKTGLDVRVRKTWKSRIAPALLDPIDEPGTWREHALAFPLWSVAVGFSLAKLWTWLHARHGIAMPFWILGVLVIMAVFAYFYLFSRWRLLTQRREPLG